MSHITLVVTGLIVLLLVAYGSKDATVEARLRNTLPEASQIEEENPIPRSRRAANTPNYQTCERKPSVTGSPTRCSCEIKTTASNVDLAVVLNAADSVIEAASHLEAPRGSESSKNASLYCPRGIETLSRNLSAVVLELGLLPDDTGGESGVKSLRRLPEIQRLGSNVAEALRHVDVLYTRGWSKDRYRKKADLLGKAVTTLVTSAIDKREEQVQEKLKLGTRFLEMDTWRKQMNATVGNLKSELQILQLHVQSIMNTIELKYNFLEDKELTTSKSVPPGLEDLELDSTEDGSGSGSGTD